MPFFVMKKELMFIREKEKKIEDCFPLREIKKDCVILKSGEEITILKVEPINFKLKSSAEQNAILNSYEAFLKQCDFDMQIFVETQKADVKKHVEEIEKCVLYEENVRDVAKDYIQFIHEISEVRGSISRKFFVVVKTDEKNRKSVISKVKEGLASCGNMVDICETEDLSKIFRVCFKRFVSNVAVGSNIEQF